MKNTEEKEQEEKSLQMLFMEISRHYAGRCFQQIEELEIHPSQMPFIMILSTSLFPGRIWISWNTIFNPGRHSATKTAKSCGP